MKMNKLIWISTLLCLAACGAEDMDYYPKPNGYLRMDFPERTYSRYSSGCVYSFEMPEYFTVVDKDSFCNMKDVVMERFNASLLLTYIPVDTNLAGLIEKSRGFVYEHSTFADAIEETPVIDPARRAFGLKYKIEGDAASPFQFYLTDSTRNFLRGALYFNVAPNYDSIQPSLTYIMEDLDRMIQTLTWRNDSLP
jgi:gliding motility-associated lipoprotein GldD